MADQPNPSTITLKGRLSWPKLTMAEAIAGNTKSKYPKAADKIVPTWDMLLDETNKDKLITYVKDVFLPWCAAQHAADPKSKSALTPAQVKKLEKIIDAEDWEVDALHGLINPVHEKTAPLAPEAVVQIRAKGWHGRDVIQKAIVHDEAELANPEDQIIPDRGKIYPIEETNLEFYPGCYVTAQLNLFAYTGANVGITASAETLVLSGDADRFGGGEPLDEDEIFLSE